MGAFDTAPNNITIPDDEADPHAAAAFRKRWKWEPHEVVIMRGVFTAGDTEALTNASVSVDKQRNPTAQAGTGQLRLLHRMIVDWTFQIGGQKAPITIENVRRLPANYSNPLLETLDSLALGMKEEEQEDFFDSANGHSRETSEQARLFLSPS